MLTFFPGFHHMNEMTFSNNGWLSCFSSEYYKELYFEGSFITVEASTRLEIRGTNKKKRKANCLVILESYF